MASSPEFDYSFPLFVPGDRPERIAKAWAAGSDAIIIDLEDAVAETDKKAARTQVRVLLTDHRPAAVATYLRINGSDTPWHEEDLALVKELTIDGVMLPKTQSSQSLQALRETLKPAQKILGLIETAAGLARVREIAHQCDRLVFGSIDYCSDLGMAHTQTALLHARSEIVLASRIANLPGPLDGVTTATRDQALIQADATHSAELGFTGKLLIHPAQIKPARRGFAPGAEQLDWAQRIMDAVTKDGAVAVDGAMVDAPVIATAEAILKRGEILL